VRASYDRSAAGALGLDRCLGHLDILAAQMFFEERRDALHHRLAADRVAAVHNPDERHVDIGFLQRLVEYLRLFERHGSVGRSVNDQERRIVGRDVGDRRRLFGRVSLVLDRAAQQQVDGRRAASAFETPWSQEVGRTAERHDTTDPAGLIGRTATAFQRFHSAAGAEQVDQMAAGRAAPHADPLGIDVVLVRVGAQPADGRLAVVDLRGPDGFAAEPVADRRPDVVPGGHERQHPPDAAGFVAAAPPAAVNEDDQRQRFVGCRLRQDEIELQRPSAAVAVDDVPVDDDFVRCAAARRLLPRLSRLLGERPDASALPLTEGRFGSVAQPVLHASDVLADLRGYVDSSFHNVVHHLPSLLAAQLPVPVQIVLLFQFRSRRIFPRWRVGRSLLLGQRALPEDTQKYDSQQLEMATLEHWGNLLRLENRFQAIISA
jgi:hypothetical protein